MRRLLLIAGGALLAFILLAALVVWLYLRAGFPEYEQELQLYGLTEEVEVLRDDRGVAHVRAATEADVFFAQGYVHAQERLWQMDFQRRVVEGRLSEIFGDDQLDADRFLRTVGLHRVAARVLEHTSPDGVRALEWYAAGVNAHLETARVLPIEFRVLGIEPEPWEPVHSAGLVALMAYNLGDNWREEAARLAVRAVVDDALFQEILPPFERQGPATWTPAQSLQELSSGALELLERGRLDGISAHMPQLGSNSWVVAPERSATGRALLANDPHLQLGLPALWYENRLETEDGLDVYGWSIPGGPGVIVGHTGAAAWGLTNTGDTQDLFLEEAHQEMADRFLYDGSWYDAEVVTEEIVVSGREEPVEHEVRFTRHGPIVQEAPPLSLRWTAYAVDRSTIDAVLGMNRAGNWEDFRTALEHFSVPAQNIVYADTTGTIAFRTAGDLPIRRQGRGNVSAPGDNPDYGWERMISFDELPELVNPPRGYIATANHRITTDEYPYLLVNDAAPAFRMQRIVDALEAGEKLGLDDFEVLQTDWTNLHASIRLPQFLGALGRYQDEFSDSETRGVELLRSWAEAPVSRRDEAAPAIFSSWYLQVMQEAFEGPMGVQAYREFTAERGYMAVNALEHLLDQDISAWFPDGIEPVLYRSYVRAIESLETRLGSDPDSWRWDQVQSVEFPHVLGESPLLRPLVNRGPYAYGGDRATVGRAFYRLTQPFEVVAAAGVRFMAEMRSPIHVRATVAGGQSGHPTHRHYGDQLDAWLEGTYYDLSHEAAPEHYTLLRSSAD